MIITELLRNCCGKEMGVRAVRVKSELIFVSNGTSCFVEGATRMSALNSYRILIFFLTIWISVSYIANVSLKICKKLLDKKNF